MGPSPSPRTSQPPEPLPAIGRGMGIHCLSSSLVDPEKWAHQGLVPNAASTLTSTASSTFAHIPTPPPSPRPARPFVLIPDSAAPAAAAKRALHFRFRTTPPPVVKRRPFLPPSPRPFLHPSPTVVSSPRRVCWESGGGGASRPCSLVRLSPLPINP